MTWLHPLPPASAWVTLRWGVQRCCPPSCEPPLRPRLQGCDPSLAFGQENCTQKAQTRPRPPEPQAQRVGDRAPRTPGPPSRGTPLHRGAPLPAELPWKSAEQEKPKWNSFLCSTEVLLDVCRGFCHRSNSSSILALCSFYCSCKFQLFQNPTNKLLKC